MKIAVKIILLACLVIVMFITITEVKSCVTEKDREIERLQGRLQAHTAEAEAKDQESQEKIQALEEEKQLLLADIETIESEQEEVRARNREYSAEIDRLMGEFALIADDNWEAKYNNAESRAGRWEGKFFLMQEDRDKEHVKFLDMKGAREIAEEQIREEVKAKLAYKEALEKMKQDLGEAGSRVKKNKIVEGAKIAVGVGGWLLYGLSRLKII